jgi:hypothetical protein
LLQIAPKNVGHEDVGARVGDGVGTPVGQLLHKRHWYAGDLVAEVPAADCIELVLTGAVYEHAAGIIEAGYFMFGYGAFHVDHFEPVLAASLSLHCLSRSVRWPP